MISAIHNLGSKLSRESELEDSVCPPVDKLWVSSKLSDPVLESTSYKTNVEFCCAHCAICPKLKPFLGGDLLEADQIYGSSVYRDFVLHHNARSSLCVTLVICIYYVYLHSHYADTKAGFGEVQSKEKFL